MNFVSPFQPEREFKVYNSCKCSQILCAVEYINTSILISNFLKLLNKLYNELGE